MRPYEKLILVVLVAVIAAILFFTGVGHLACVLLVGVCGISRLAVGFASLLSFQYRITRERAIEAAINLPAGVGLLTLAYLIMRHG